MPYNGSGSFGRVYDWETEASLGNPISSSKMDTEMDGFAAGFGNAICRDGQSTISADIPFNSKKITGLGAATGNGDAVRYEQVFGAFQPLDASLTAYAALTTAADKSVYYSAADTPVTFDFTSVGRTLVGQATQALMRTTGLGMSANGSALVAAADYAAMKALLDLEIGTDIASQTTADGKEPLGEAVAINTQTGSYTLVLGDKGKIIEMNVGSANNLTIPPNSSVAFPINTRIDIAQYGAGQTSFVAGSGVTIRSSGSKLKLTGQYSAASLYKRGTDEWLLVGDLAS